MRERIDGDMDKQKQPPLLLAATNIIANPTLEDFNRLGIELEVLLPSQIDRPTLNTTAGGEVYGEKKYIAVTAQQQKYLGIEKLGDTVFVVLRRTDAGAILPDLYLASALAPDEDLKERADKGLYNKQGISSSDVMEILLSENPLRRESIAAPFFNFTENAGEVVATGVLDLEKMTGRNITTKLICTKISEKSYPVKLVEGWSKMTRGERPLIALPNSYIRALGGRMTTSTNLPPAQGNSIAAPQESTMILNGVPQQVVLVGALDKIGFLSTSENSFPDGEALEISLMVGANIFRIETA